MAAIHQEWALARLIKTRIPTALAKTLIKKQTEFFLDI